ncbi:glycosyltransferase family 4 protein [Schleiferiaceae bacterium]|nr:glycosyltransferase family 4 protein [Schleiferiaceae bacterium]
MKVLMTGNRLEDKIKGGMVSCASLLLKCNLDIDYFWTWSREKHLGNISFLCRVMREHRGYDIYHLHTAAKVDLIRNLLLIVFFKRSFNKVILHIHGSGFASKVGINPITKYVFQRVDKFIVLSESWRSHLSKEWGISEDYFYVLCNPIESRNTNVILNSLERALKVCFVGELSERKGIMSLLNAVPLLSKSFEYYIAGEGLLKEKVLVEIGLLQDLGYIVNFCGFLQSSERDVLLDSCDILVLPSQAENLPISIIEAMHSSCAIVATNVGAVGTLVDSKNGVLLENASSYDISQALNHLLESDLNSLKKISYERSLDYLGEKVTEKLEAIYADVSRR